MVSDGVRDYQNMPPVGGAIMAAEFPPTGPCNVYIVQVEELERTSSRPQ